MPTEGSHQLALLMVGPTSRWKSGISIRPDAYRSCRSRRLISIFIRNVPANPGQPQQFSVRPTPAGPQLNARNWCRRLMLPPRRPGQLVVATPGARRGGPPGNGRQRRRGMLARRSTTDPPPNTRRLRSRTRQQLIAAPASQIHAHAGMRRSARLVIPCGERGEKRLLALGHDERPLTSRQTRSNVHHQRGPPAIGQRAPAPCGRARSSSAVQARQNSM